MTESGAVAVPFRAGTIAVVGRPNVGKSTLINFLVGQKISITSRKAQTTRHAIRGVLTRDHAQYVFIDTPGFQTKHSNALNRAMNRTVRQVLEQVDVILFLADAAFTAEDRKVVVLLPKAVPTILVFSKADQVKKKSELLPLIAAHRSEFPFAEFVPVSVKRKESTEALLGAIALHLPEQEALFDAEMLTDKSERFLATELIREKIFRLLGDELPYSAGVSIEQYQEEGRLRKIQATILVDKPGHKAIFIGTKGETLKRIGTEARLEMEKLFDAKVHLELWVKVKGGWADSEKVLQSLGYQ